MHAILPDAIKIVGVVEPSSGLIYTPSMTELILTEKFSVASDFAKALGITKKSNGFFRNECTVITWAVGHLVELFEPEDYDVSLKKWSISSLPIIPEKFRYKPIKRTSGQLEIIKSLLKAGDIERVIIATDAGREGEVIARTILLESGFTDKERIFRFWTSQALVPDVVRKSMAELRSIYHYDRLWRAGYYRQVADWLVGMNCTRMMTLRLHGELFSIGRVQTAVLALIVERKRERDNFVPEQYWILKVIFSNEKGIWSGHWFREDAKGEDQKSAHIIRSKEEIESLCSRLHHRMGIGMKGEGGTSIFHGDPAAATPVDSKKMSETGAEERSKRAAGYVQSVNREKKKEPPPPLFSLTDLQQEANRRFGFPAQKTLTIAQSLYQDRKCLSYPRTDSRVLGSQNLDMVKNIMEKMHGAFPEKFSGILPERLSLSNRRVFNDAKLTDHHALIPFKPLGQGASRDESSVFNLVVTRFAAVFHPDCEFENTTVITRFEDDHFRSRGKVIIKPGWRALYSGDQTRTQSDIPSTGKSQSSKAESREEELSKEQEEAQSLPPLVKGDAAKPEQICPEEKETTPPPEYTDSLILKDMTNPGKYVEEEELKKFYRGDTGIGTQATRAQILETLISRQYIERSGKKLIPTDKGSLLIKMLKKCPVTSVLTSPEETARWEMRLNEIALGEAPGTNAPSNFPAQVTAAGSGTKNSAFPSAAAATPNAINSTFNEKSFLESIKEFVISSINELKAVKFEESSFSMHAPASRVIGICPGCGGSVLETRKNFSCSESGCSFSVNKKISGKMILPSMVSDLLKFRKAGPFGGFFSREKKKSFKASLILSETDGKWGVSLYFGNSGESEPKSSSKGKSRYSDKDGYRSKDADKSESAEKKSLPICPVCGGNIIEGKRAYGCSNWRPENGNCRFVIWKEIMGRKLTEKNIATLLSGKKTAPYILKHADGEKLKARLEMIRTGSISGAGGSNFSAGSGGTYAIRIIPEERSLSLPKMQSEIICER